jgi:hypothetical protein
LRSARAYIYESADEAPRRISSESFTPIYLEPRRRPINAPPGGVVVLTRAHQRWQSSEPQSSSTPLPSTPIRRGGDTATPSRCRGQNSLNTWPAPSRHPPSSRQCQGARSTTAPADTPPIVTVPAPAELPLHSTDGPAAAPSASATLTITLSTASPVPHGFTHPFAPLNQREPMHSHTSRCHTTHKRNRTHVGRVCQGRVGSWPPVM